MIESPRVQNKYAEHYNAVDKNDRDSADYSTSIRTTRYYLRIFFWILDRVVYTCYVVVCSLANANVGNKCWKQYCTRNGGRRRFQIDLAIQLINYAIEKEWTNFEDDTNRPKWIRQGELIRCDCDKCFFAKRVRQLVFLTRL